MSPEYLGLILLGALLTGIFVGFPIAFTLIILSVVFGYIGIGPQVFYLMVFQTVGRMKEEILAAVPLFIFMGYVLEQAGLMERLFKGFQLILAPVRGSLYLGVLLTATLFAAATGIIGASVTVMGLMAAPTMIRSRYDVALSAGAITAGGTLGILIPPSVMLVVLAPVAGISIVKLLAAAVIPGLVLSSLYIIYAMVRSFLNPRLGPPLPLEDRASSYGVMIKELFLGIIPMAVLIFAALGSILAGLATPTEAAAMGALGAIVLMLAYRRMTWQAFRQAVYSTLQTSSMVLFLAVASNIYGSVFTRLGTTTLLAETLLGLPLSPMAMLALLMLVIFILGWPLEWPVIVFIFVPIFLPVVEGLNYDLVWFCTLVAVNLQTAFLSPPQVSAQNVLKIGVLGVMSGPAASWGLVNKYCAEATAQMVNDKGGVDIDGKTYQIAIVSVDDKNDPKLAVSGAEHLVNQEGIKYIIGPNMDATAASIVPVIEAAGAINIPYAFSKALYSPPRSNSILGMIASYQSGPIIYKYLQDKRSITSVSFIARNESDPLNQRNRGVEAAKRLGLKIVSSEDTYEPGTTDFLPVMSKVVKGNADLIVLSGVAPGDAPFLIKTARELGYKGTLSTETAQDIKALNEVAGKAADGFIAVGGASTPEIRSKYMGLISLHGTR